MKAGALLLALIMSALALAACAGFDFGDVVKVPTPAEIQQTTGAPSRLSLNEADAAYRAWLDDTQRAGVAWRNSIERGNEIRSMLGQLTMGALADVGPSVAGVPILSSVSLIAPALGAWFFGRRSGSADTERLYTEKIESYNTALKRAQSGEEPNK